MFTRQLWEEEEKQKGARHSQHGRNFPKGQEVRNNNTNNSALMWHTHTYVEEGGGGIGRESWLPASGL